MDGSSSPPYAPPSDSSSEEDPSYIPQVHKTEARTTVKSILKPRKRYHKELPDANTTPIPSPRTLGVRGTKSRDTVKATLTQQDPEELPDADPSSSSSDESEPDLSRYSGPRRTKCHTCYTQNRRCINVPGQQRCKFCFQQGRNCKPPMKGAKRPQDQKDRPRPMQIAPMLNPTPCNHCVVLNARCYIVEGQDKCVKCINKTTPKCRFFCYPASQETKDKYAKPPPTVKPGYVSKSEAVPPSEGCGTCNRKHRFCDGKEPCTPCVFRGLENCRVRGKEAIVPCNRCKTNNRRCNDKRPCTACLRGNEVCIETSDNGLLKKTWTGSNQDQPQHYEDEDGDCRHCIRHKQTCHGEPCITCVKFSLLPCNENKNFTCIFDRDGGLVEKHWLSAFALDPQGNVIQIADTRIKRGPSKNAPEFTDDSESEDEDETYVPPSQDVIPRFKPRKDNNDDDQPGAGNGLEKLKRFICASVTATAKVKEQLHPSDPSKQANPNTFKQAMSAPDAHHWKDAAESEYYDLVSNQTWRRVKRTPHMKVITCKWVWKKKFLPSGEIAKYKARLVARGFEQTEGLDFTETFATVVRSASYRMMFAIGAMLGWYCHQMDVVTAFLNGELDELIYMQPPPGFPEDKDIVLLLLKSLYGLKQSPRQWYKRFKDWLLAHGWEISEFDPCLFYHRKRQLWMTLYVDDLNIFSPSEHAIIDFKAEIMAAFKMTDAGTSTFYLGMQIDQQPGATHIYLQAAITEALQEYGLQEIRPVKTPSDKAITLKDSPTQAEPSFHSRYRSMTGSLTYIAMKGRPDISHATSMVSRYNSNPDQTHQDAVNRIFAYLKGTIDYGTCYSDNTKLLEGFVDSDFSGCPDTSRSTTGWIFMLGGAPISWQSQRQGSISHSTAESEYVAASEAAREAIWVKDFFNELAIPGLDPMSSIQLNVDNEAAIKLTKNPEFHTKTKHIRRRHHHIRELVTSGQLNVQWVPSAENIADIFTKPLHRIIFERLRTMAGIVPRPKNQGELQDSPMN